MQASPLYKTLVTILHGPKRSSNPSNPSVHVLDYSNVTTFKSLWLDGLETASLTIGDGENRQSFDWANGKHHLLMVGNEPPADAFDFLNRPGMPPVDVLPHFSACSWAAAFRLLNPKAQVHIVIVESRQRSSVVAADLAQVFAMKEARTAAVVPGVTVLCSPTLSEIVAALQQPPPPQLTIGQMGVLRGIIQQHLLPNAEDHHKMGNIVGALLLDRQAKSGVSIVGCLFRALLPETNFEPVAPQFAPPVDASLVTRLANGPEFVVFDDMGALWKPFLSQWIADAKLHIAEVNAQSRTHLLNRIKALASEPIQKRTLKASDFGITTIGDDSPLVLLLDLRLFAGDQRNEEAEFVYQLMETGQCVANATHLKWPAINECELKEGIEVWYEKQVFSPAFRRVRSWLPRLISLIDPTLPVAIFSSTQDPEVLKEFSPYGNIITAFAKPMFRGALGETREWAGAAILNFEKALRATMKISAANLILSSINCSLSHRSGGTAHGRPTSSVEIFIDESGTAAETRFALGAVVLISGNAAFDHSGYRHSAIAGQQPLGIWGLDDITTIRSMQQLPPSHLWLPKGKHCQTGQDTNANYNSLLDADLRRIENLVAAQGASIFACSLLSIAPPDLTIVASAKHPFHRYRDMLARFLEAILFYLEPVTKALTHGAELSIDAATVKNDATGWNPQRLKDQFGADIFSEFENGRTTYKCRTISRSDLSAIVTGLLVRSGRENWTDQVVRARALQLTNFSECDAGTLNNQKRLDPKPLHHMADWIAHFTYDARDWAEVPNISTLNRWFSLGFRQEDNEVWKAQLRSHRRWMQGARVAAFKGWANTCHTNIGGDVFSLGPRLASRAAEWIESLNGDELTTLFHS